MKQLKFWLIWLAILCCTDRGSSPIPDHVNINFVMKLSKYQWEEIILTVNIQVEGHITSEYLEWQRHPKSCSKNLYSQICQLSNLAKIIIFEINLRCLAFFGVDRSIWYKWHITWRKFWYIINFLNIEYCPLRGKNCPFLLKKSILVPCWYAVQI